MLVAQTEFQNAYTGDEIRFFSTLLNEVALQKRVLTAAGNNYTNGQGWHRMSHKWNGAGSV